MVGAILRIGFVQEEPADFDDVRPSLAADVREDWLLAEDVDHWAKTQIS